MSLSCLLFLGLLPTASATLPQGCAAFVPCIGTLDIANAAANATYIPPACFATVLQDPPPTSAISNCNVSSWNANSVPLRDMGNDCLVQVGTYIAGNCLDAAVSLPLAAAQLTTTFPNMDMATLSESDKLTIKAEIRAKIAAGLAMCCNFDPANAWSLGVEIKAGSVVAITTLPLYLNASQAAAASAAIGIITANGEASSGPSAVTNPKVSTHESSGECGDAVTDADMCMVHCMGQDPAVFEAKYFEAVPWLINFQQCECVGKETWTACGGQDHLDFTLLILIVLVLLCCCILCCCKCCGCLCFGKKKDKRDTTVEAKGMEMGNMDKAAPTPDPYQEGISQSLDGSGGGGGDVADPVAEPAAEPVANPVADPVTNPVAEPAAEPAAEPVANPVADH